MMLQFLKLGSPSGVPCNFVDNEKKLNVYCGGECQCLLPILVRADCSKIRILLKTLIRYILEEIYHLDAVSTLVYSQISRT